ncbi:MAG: hypothetical protein ACJ763_00650, partial [Bdellovibrionia bacterium]
DSNSTGLIEITMPKNGEHVVRDVRDWNSKEPYFLKDVHDEMLHYYFSPLHGTTKFAKEGRNPPILSAIRFLTKAFQYELKIRPEDLEQIKKVIQEFDPKETAKNDYVAKWIEKNGKKLIQNAVNIEYAKNTLEQLGLREKLQSIKGDVSLTESLAWWMNKEPLRSHALGQGTGKTAKELGLDIVAHETKTFLAYESITRAHTGDPNVLISRNDASEESAAYGDGFYTKTGKEGARGTGLTIRFHLDPNAREGHDFSYVPEHDFVVVKNKTALKVIPESLDIGPLEYFQMLSSSESQLKSSDRGILEKLRRRIDAKLQAISDEEFQEILKIIQSEVQNSRNLEESPVLSEWFSLPTSAKHPEIVTAVLNKGTADKLIVRYALSQPHWKNHPEWVEQLLKKRKLHFEIIDHVLSQPHWKNHPEWVEEVLNHKALDFAIAEHVLSQPHSKDYPQASQWVEKILRRGDWDLWIAHYVLDRPHWKDHPEWIERLLKKGTVKSDTMEVVLAKPHWKEHPELRRLAENQDPTVENLKAAFARGESVRTTPPTRNCVLQFLAKIFR